MKRILSLIFFAVFVSGYGYSQSAAFKKIASKLSSKTIKKEALHSATKRSEKELLKEGIERTGRKYTGQALGEQVVKKSLRKSIMEKMEKEGIESFFGYSKFVSDNTIKRIGKSKINVFNEAKRSSLSNYTNAVRNSAGESVARNAAKKSSFKSKYLAEKIAKSLLQKELNTIKAKGAIELTEKELDYLLKNPKALRTYIKQKGGGSSNFKEFFIRLSMTKKGQTNIKTMMANPDIRRYVDRSIRNGGGKHEWLMAKNFTDFLTNPKWGEDGQYLALAMTRLVQNTEKVVFKYGGKHGSTYSGKFHNGLAKVIDNCSSKEELFIEVKKYAKQNLSKESYADFAKVFSNIFAPA